MLAEEKWTPIKCSVDRPSEKLVRFLKKYYGLENIIPQTNKFVLYEGFFDDAEQEDRVLRNYNISKKNIKKFRRY
ncbi:unnamed protein product [Ceratitis capitata]|uniref:(Mediterranean fruit fly) hypothetical protein n=1 Tax=Ceratitis capitata TaxID=7213 RepID=A0A811UVZ8_CERCA|nr:unnamed protein product [Ceratitis capitata]